METREQDLSFGTHGLKIGLKLLGEITKLEKVRVYMSPTVVYCTSVYWKEHQGMYMDRTLRRLGSVKYLQNVYKLLLHKCT